MRRVSVALLSVFLFSGIGRAGGPSAEIEALISEIDRSTYTFVRNGEDHTGHEAAEHIGRKYGQFRPQIHSSEDFIRLAATKSELTGQPYLVEMSPGKAVRCDAWLTARLQEMRRGDIGHSGSQR